MRKMKNETYKTPDLLTLSGFTEERLRPPWLVHGSLGDKQRYNL